MTGHLNNLALQRLQRLVPVADSLRIRFSESGRVADFGVAARGGLSAGLELARICMADLGTVNLLPAPAGGTEPLVQVFTDCPAVACMGAQYGGWPVRTDDYFAIGSGPIRLRRGKEAVLEQYRFSSREDSVVGVLEVDRLPNEPVIQYMAEQCGLDATQLWLCVAPLAVWPERSR